MFMLFINDIVQNINSDINSIFTIDKYQLFMLLYADDAVVFAKSPEALQSILNDLELDCATWGLNINISKTKVMIFEKGRHTNHDFYLNNVKLEMVSSFKYLGIHFFKILNVRKCTNLSGLYGELGRVPFLVTRKIRMINYWIKILKLEVNSLPKKVNNMLKTDADNNISYNGANWASQIKTLLDELGLTYIWLQQDDPTIPLSLIKQRILDSYKQSWYANINNSIRLQTYARYKHDFEFEDYLDFIQEKKYKIAFTKFRLSSHDLAIERGRFENIERNDRLCRHCNLNMIESEYICTTLC